jgi:hypothetical protein
VIFIFKTGAGTFPMLKDDKKILIFGVKYYQFSKQQTLNMSLNIKNLKP